MLAAGQLLFFSVWVDVCCGYVDWIFPGPNNPNLTFNYIDIVYFTWASSVEQPYMNLWCSPTPSDPQSKDYLYHAEVPTNGSNPQSFPYSGYNQKGVCHMQVEDFAGDDFKNTPTFGITSNDGVEPTTWGLDALGKAGGSPEPSAIQQLESIPASVLAAATSTPSNSPSSSLAPSASSSSPASSAFHTTISPSTSLSSHITAPATQSTPSLPQSTSSQDLTDHNKTTLTPAVKAGISIGSISAFLALILVLLLARFMWSRQRRQQRARVQAEESYNRRIEGPQDLLMSSMYQEEQQVTESGGGRMGRSELDAEGMPHELQGRPRAELFCETGAMQK